MADFSWDQLWETGKSQIGKAFDDVVATGTPAIKASLEQWAINALQESTKDTRKELQTQVTNLMDQTNDSAFAQAARQAIGDVAQDTFFDKYGLHIIGGVLVIAIIGAYIARK